MNRSDIVTCLFLLIHVEFLFFIKDSRYIRNIDSPHIDVQFGILIQIYFKIFRVPEADSKVAQ